MQRSTIITLLLLLLILGIVGFFTWQASTTSNQTAEPSAAAQAFASSSSDQGFSDFLGNPAHLEQHVGSVIVAHAWATWVPTSPESLRDLSTLQREFAADGVQVIAINRGEPAATARLFLAQQDIDNLKLIDDAADQYFTSVGGQTMPETIFYDAAGNVVFHQRGTMTLDQLRLQTTTALRQSNVDLDN